MTKQIMRKLGIASAVICIASAAISVGGLFLPYLYRDNAFVTVLWKANDWMTLLLALPVLVLAIFLSGRGSKVGTVVWLGMMDYMAYNYAFYLFAAAFNGFFIPYVVLFTGSVAIIIRFVVGLDANPYADRSAPRPSMRVVGAYLTLIALSLCGIYLSQYAVFIRTGILRSIITKTGHPTNIVFALDLSTVVPVLLLAAALLWKGNPWGTVLSGMVLVKGIVYHAVLTAASLFASKNGFPESADEIPIWMTLLTTELIAFTVVARNIPSTKAAVTTA